MAKTSDESRSARGRLGAFVTHSRHDPRETTQKGRAAFLARFERQVDPEGELAPEERARRAEFARRAYFLGLALRSARVRAARKGSGKLIGGPRPKPGRRSPSQRGGP